MKKCLLFIILSVCHYVIHAQDQPTSSDRALSIQGKVMEKSTGQPLAGVQVTLKSDAKNTVLTNVIGVFNITVPSGNAVLIIHALGYTDLEVPVDGKTFLTIDLEAVAASNLDEVVVVGAVIKRRDLTGSVATIDSRRIGITPTTDINQAIQGKVAGVYITNSAQPGSASTIKVRGSNSINFGTGPIFVVDGVIMDGNYNTLNPDDVASMEVLKDASATALYGSRGSNGVILVTTKRGKKGTGKIDYNAWIGWSKYARKMKFLNTHDLYNLRADAFANQYMEANPGADRQAYLNRITSDTSKLVFAQYEKDSYRQNKTYDWVGAVSRGAMQQNHTLDFNGGTDKGTYYISLNYTDQKGLLKGSDYQRMGARVNIDQNVKSWLKVGTYTTYTHSKADITDGSVFSTAAGANPMLPIDTTAMYVLKWADINNQDQYNPLRSLYIQNQQYINRLLTSNYISVSPIKDLTIRSTFSADIYNQQQYTYVPMTTGQDKRNSNHGNAIQYKGETTNLQWDNAATYSRNFGEHHLDFLIGTSMQKNINNYNKVTAYGFPSDDFGYMYLGGAYSRDRQVLESDFITTTLMSYIGRANYSWKGKYFATATLRYDGSSKFGPNNRWGAFPSLAIAYDMSRENFMTNLAIISHWKWRAGYGIVGNQNIPNYAFVSLYRPSYTNGAAIYRNDGRMGNPDIQWERQKQLNIGADIGLLQDRLQLTAEYFDIRNDKLLMVRTLALTSGFKTVVFNVGALQNRGLEFTLNYAIVRSKELQWNFNFMISRDRNKITKLYGLTPAIYNKGGFTSVEIQRTGNLFVGESLNNIYTYKFAKIAQVSDTAKLSGINFGRTVHPGDIVPVDRDGNNIINDNDRYVVGKTDPNFYGGFGTDLTYKGFGINVFFNYSSGLKRISYAYESAISSAGITVASTDMLNRWTPTHTNTNIPRAVYGGGRFTVSDVDLAIQDASFLRMAVLSLSYTIPKRVNGKAIFDNARIYVTGSNLLLFTKDKGYDPETGDNFPNTKTFSMGLNLSL